MQLWYNSLAVSADKLALVASHVMDMHLGEAQIEETLDVLSMLVEVRRDEDQRLAETSMRSEPIGFRAEPVITMVSFGWRASWIVAEKIFPIQTAATASESRPRKSSGT